MIDIEKVKRELSDGGIRFQFYNLKQIDSTNRFTLSLAKQGAPQGVVVCAEYQTKGRGRMAREWLSLPGENLLFTILLRPRVEIEAAQKISLAAAIIVYKALCQYVENMGINGIEFDVKWPNDILSDGSKICGILAESVLRDKRVETLALGFGINLNMQPIESEKLIKQKIASLKALTGRQIDRTDFLIHFLRLFDKEYLRMESDGFTGVVSQWKAITRQIGRKIIIQGETAEFVDLSAQGYLIYKMADGKISELTAGDVQWL